MRTNCKGEFLTEVDSKSILCAWVSYGADYWLDGLKKKSMLPVGYTENEFNLFLDSLDFDYDAGYGGQEVFGVIWYTDGTRSERGEYDGSEWWEYKSVPELPDELTQKNYCDVQS